MALYFTAKAFQDISAIDDYLSDKSPQGLRSVLTSLQRSFIAIETNPRYGRPTLRAHVRLAVEPSYSYRIYYYSKGADIWILRVYHPKRISLELATLELPKE